MTDTLTSERTDADGEPVWAFAGLPQSLPEGRYAFEPGEHAWSPTDIALGWMLGSYAFDRYRKPKRAPATLVWPDAADRAEVERLAHGVCLARDLINTPAEDMCPAQLADAAQSVAAARGARLNVITGDDLLQHNYPTIHIVGHASARAPRLIDLRWGDERAPRLTLVGKGVCFDTGGLDLKSREGMLGMKKDMGGAAVMLGLADALMAAGVPIRLRVLIPAVENSVELIDGKCADLVNVAQGPFAGSIIGALYLAEFVSASTRWAHLDIMAANVSARPGRPEGGEATGLRALYAYVRTRYG